VKMARTPKRPQAGSRASTRRQKTVRRLTPRFLVKKGDRLYWQPPKYLRELGLARTTA
jgi:hypothetical protein